MALVTIESILHERRLFNPPASFSQAARIKDLAGYRNLWNRAQDDPLGFWEELAAQELHWFKPWTQVLDWQPPFAQWFVNGKTNA